MASEEELEADAAAARACFGDIHLAAGHGDVPALRHFLRAAPGQLHQKWPSTGNTPLHFAAYWGKVEAAELLLAKGAVVDAKNNEGDMPLHLAARNGHVEAARLLLAKGAAVDAKNNDGKTPLDRARENGKTKMEQFLRNSPAKEPSADDGKMPHDLSNKGKAEIKPLSMAADKTSEAQQTPAFAFSSPPRQTSKEAVVQAAKELQAAMDSGDAQVLKNAIDNAKLHKVSQEDIMKALEKYIALQEAANQSATSPVGKAAKELQGAMDSGDAQVLKNAIDNAKLHKVSQEDIMKALEKYIALQEAANQSATSPVKEATSSKAESSVKLEPGHGARLAMFSARFNEKNKDTETKFRAVHKILVDNHYDVLMVEAGAGKSFGVMTLDYLRRLGEEKGVMLAVCTSDYGEMTDSPYCTYYELQLAKEYKVDVLPLQVEDNWKPNPPCGEGHLDHSKSALSFIHAVFIPSIVRIDCRNKPAEEIAREIAAALRRPA